MNPSNMPVPIRMEIPADHQQVEQLITTAFAEVAYSDQTEHLLVARLRKTEAFIPELSLVAEMEGQIVGHILMTRIHILEGGLSHPSLALAPVSVHPAFQGQGIGAQLIKDAHRRAAALGFDSAVLVGHADYYPRFGYERCARFNIRLPFEVPDENAMAIALRPNGLANVSGEVQYDPAFFE